MWPSLQHPPFNPIAFQGLESPQPVIQLDNYFFQGTYEDTVGTSLVFKEEEESELIIAAPDVTC